jgi:hypothetical protein
VQEDNRHNAGSRLTLTEVSVSAELPHRGGDRLSEFVKCALIEADDLIGSRAFRGSVVAQIRPLLPKTARRIGFHTLRQQSCRQQPIRQQECLAARAGSEAGEDLVCLTRMELIAGGARRTHHLDSGGHFAGNFDPEVDDVVVSGGTLSVVT